MGSHKESLWAFLRRAVLVDYLRQSVEAVDDGGDRGVEMTDHETQSYLDTGSFRPTTDMERRIKTRAAELAILGITFPVVEHEVNIKTYAELIAARKHAKSVCDAVCAVLADERSGRVSPAGAEAHIRSLIEAGILGP